MDINPKILSNARSFRIVGENANNDWTGYSVSGAGDVNGDGFADVIIGAPTATNQAGKSYVIFGKAGDFSDINLRTLNTTQGFRILGENAFDSSGSSVSGAGDVNKDGFADVIIGAYYATGQTGKSYVIFGKASFLSDISLSALNSTQGFRILGENYGDYCGISVGGAGDVNGDGYADVIIGAYGATRYAGKNYVIFGKESGFNDINLSKLDTAQGFRILGETIGDYTGRSVSSADINSDGFSDVIIGACGITNNVGKSYVIFGKEGNFSDISLNTLNTTQGFRILSEGYGFSGNSVNGAGDVNKDGFADVIIGAPYASDYVGESYVIFGKAGGFSDINLRKLNTTQGFRILGENREDYSGFAVSIAGDVNGDGFADIIIGAPGGEKSYVIFSKASGFSDISLRTLNATQGFRVLGEISGDYSGFSVSAAGDVNGDGYADVIIGAHGSGNSYVIFGNDHDWSQQI